MASLNPSKKDDPWAFLDEPNPTPKVASNPWAFLDEPNPTPKVASNPWAFLDEPPVVQQVSDIEARDIGGSMMGGMAGLGLNSFAPKTPATPEELLAIAQSEDLREKENRSYLGPQNLLGLGARGALDIGAGGSSEGVLTIVDDIIQGTRKVGAAPDLPSINYKLAILGEKRRAITNPVLNQGGPINTTALAEMDAEIAAQKIEKEAYLLSRKSELDKVNKSSYLEPAMAKVGEFRQAVRDVYPVDADVEASIPGQTITALGQVVSQIPLALTGLGIPAVVGQMFDQTYQEALKAGKSKEIARAAGYANMPMAALEQLGNVAKLKTLRAAFSKNPTQRAATDLLEAIAIEGGTEGAQQIGGNVVARKYYDPKRDVFEGVPTAALVGSLAGGVTSAAGIGAGRIMGSENPENLAKQDPGTLFPDQKRAVLNLHRKNYENLTPDQKEAIDYYDLTLHTTLQDAIKNNTPVAIDELSDYNEDATTPIVLPKDWVQDGDYYVPKGYVAPAAPGTPAAAAPGTAAAAPSTPAAAVVPSTPAAAAAAAAPAPAPTAPPEVKRPLAVKTNEELDQDVEYFDSQLAMGELTKADHKKEMAKIKKQRLLAPAVVEETPVAVVEETSAPASAPLAATGTPVTPVVAEAAPETPVAATPAPAPAPAAMATPAPAAPVAATPAPAPALAAEDPVLPRTLRSAKTYYKQSPIEFTSDLDLALYIVSSKTPSKQRPAYLAWIKKSTGLTEAQAISEGAKVRTEIAKRHNDSPSAPISLPVTSTRKNPVRQSTVAATPAPAPAPAKKPRRIAKTVEDFILPKILKAAKTFYRKSALNFTSDLDLALYIVSSKKPSKQRPAYLDWVMKSTGLTEAQALSEGAKIRTEIAKRYDDSSDAPISLPVTSTRKNLVRQSLTEDPTYLTLSEDISTELWFARFNVQHARRLGFKPSPSDLKIVLENAPVVDPRKQFLSEMQTEAEAELEVWKKNNPRAPKVLVVSRPEWQQNGRGVQGQHSVDGGIVINSAYAMSRGSTISKVASHEYAHALIRSLQGQEALQKFAARSIPEDQMAALQKKYPRQDGETEIEYNLKIAEEWIARNAETQPGVFQAIVEAMRGWLAKAGLVNLSNEEVARAMLRVLRSSNSDLAERESAITRQSLTDRAALLDSPNFKRWFGNSKIVDEDGNPKVFYHGTTSGEDFSTFDGGIRGVIFVSPSPEVADYFALSSEDNDNARVFPLYVRAENPFEFWNNDHLDKVLSRQPSKGSSFRERVSDGSWAALATVIDDIKAAGFDSYYEMEMGQINLGVFDPNQLKSSVSNTGEYSRTNNDVAYSLTDESVNDRTPINTPKINTVLTPEEIAAVDKRQIRDLDISYLLRKGILTERHAKMLSELRYTSGGNARIEVVNADELPPRAMGAWDGKTNRILLSRDSKMNLGRVLLHEYVHALTFMGLRFGDAVRFNSRTGESIDAKPRLGVSDSDLREASEQMDKLFSIAEKTARDQGKKFYGLTNREEFVAEAFSSKKFQNFLSSIPSTNGGKQSLFDQFIAIVKKILGTENDSLLTDVITATDPFVGATKRVDGSFMVDERPMLPSEKSIRQSLTEDDVNDRIQMGVPELTGPVRNRVRTTGQYVGMPPGVNTPDKLERLRIKLIRMTQDGMEGRYWYEKSSKKILQITQGNREDAEVLAAFIAAYSPQNKVYPNLGQAVRAYYEWKAGKKITIGKFGTDIERGQSVADGERWEGIKTNNFYINLMVEINPEIVQGATVDMWIMRVWGYKTDVPGKVRYARVEREISLIADRLTKLEADKYAEDLAAYNSNPTGVAPVAPTPWQPQQVQAAIWVAGKARYEEAAALAKKEGKKLGEYVLQAPNAEGKRQWAWVDSKNPNVPDKEIAAKWENKIFKAIYKATPVDISDSKNDFADYILRDIGQVSFEVRPGSSTGDMPGMETATPAQQLEYLVAQRNALLDEGGNNVVDRELGILVLGDEILPGVWKDETNPSIQTSVVAPRGSGLEQTALGSENKVSVTTAEQLDSKVAIEAILFKQDGAGWHRPFFVDGDRALARDANGLALRIGRGMTANELQALRRYIAEAGLQEVSEFSSIAIISEPKGVRFIYFFDTDKYSKALASYNQNPVGEIPVAPISNAEFQKRMKSAAEAMARAYAGLEFNLGRFASDGNLIENDWRKNPNGETYRQRLAETGRSDILRRIQDLYGPKIRRINFIFAQKYGWDNPAKYAEQLEPAGTPQEEIAQADASDAAFAAEEMGVPEPPLVKGSTPGVRDNQLGPRYSLMDEPISPRFTDVQMAWNKGEMTRDQYDEAMAELVKNPEGIEYPATGPAIPLVMSVDRTIGGDDIVDLPTVYKSVINVLQTLGDSAVLRTGRYAGPASGLYKEFENVIRLRKGMDRDGLPIVSHELGHSIAKSVFGTVKSSALRQALRYDPNNLPVVKQLEDLGKKLYGPTRPAIGYTGEGFAEFVRLWMTNDPDLNKYGQTTAWFEKTFIAGDPKLGASLNSAKKQLTLWRLQGSRDRDRAMSSQPKRLDKLLYRLRKETSFARRVEEFSALELLSKEYFRRTGVRLRADQDPYILASALRSTAGGVLHSWVTLGITDIYGKVVGPSLKEAYALIKPSQEEDFRTYLVSLQSQIRLKQGKDPSMSQADADNNVASLSIQYPHFAKAALDISKWWDKALDYQLMAFPEMNYQLTAAVRAANPVYYGPLMRQFTEEEKERNLVKGTSYVIKEAKGSARKLENLYLSSVRMAEGIIAKAQKDMVLKLVTDLAKTEGMGWLVEKVAVGKVMKSVDIGSIREQLESYGVDTSKLSDDAMLEYATNADARDAKDPIISIRRSTPTATDPNATTLEWYQVPREIADILQGVPDVGRLGTAFEIFIGGPNRLAKMGYVSLSIPFQLITNPIRDFYTLFMAATEGNAIEVGVGLAKAYGRLAQGALVAVTSQDFRNKYLGGLEESEISQIAQQLGLTNSTYLGGDIQEAKRLKTFLFHGKVFTTLASPVESLRSVLSITETAPRLSQLELAITKLGWKTGQDLTPEQAIAGMLAYKRATVDFSAKGNEPAYLRKGLLGPFYSAGVQGTRTLARALPFRSNPKKAVTSLLTGLTMMTMPALLSWYKYKDEEWWKNLPLREKSLYWHFVVGDEVVRIPLPQEFGTLFVGLPIAIADAIYKEDPKALTVMFGQIASVFNPAGLPVALKAAKEYVSNRRDFTDTPIVPGALQKDQPGSQFNPNTGMIAKKLGEIFPRVISPIKLENLVRSVAGSVGLNTLQGVDIVAEKLGLTKGEREPDASDNWLYGKFLRPGGKVTSNATSITEFFDDYQLLESRKLPEDKARETGTPPLNPLTTEETDYFYNLKGRYGSVKYLMDLARKENRRSERQGLYLSAAKLAREGLDTKPKDPLLPW